MGEGGVGSGGGGRRASVTLWVYHKDSHVSSSGVTAAWIPKRNDGVRPILCVCVCVCVCVGGGSG